MKRKVILICIIYLTFATFLITEQNIRNTTSTMKIHPFINIKIASKKNNSLISGYQPYQIKHAYGIDKLIYQGDGQKVAIIDAYGSPTIENDLNVFNKKYNLKRAKLQILYPNGKPSGISKYWIEETSLDVEWVHALAPKANIMLIISKSQSFDDLLDAVDYASKEGANIVTMSWGCPEFPNESNYDSHFKNKNITYISSTGDIGDETEWPAVSPNVLAVGGTSLILNSGGNLIQHEIGWFGSGWGISSYEPEPEYQKTYGIQSSNYRTIPDVSFLGDPNNGVSVYSSVTGWIVTGGTSLGPPAWGAFISIVKQNLKIPLCNVQNNLYQLALNKQYSSVFRNPHKMYNYITGLGSPIENKLYDAIKNTY